MTLRLSTLCALLALSQLAAEPRIISIPNGDFEQELASWTVRENVPMTSLSDEQAVSGKHSLKIVDADEKDGSWAYATRVPFQGAAAVAVRGQYFPVSGSGLGIYVVQYSAAGERISGESHIAGMGGNERKWRPFTRTFYTLPDCAELELCFHSYGAARVEGYFDDLEFALLSTDLKPPWEGTYKLTKDDTLTPADVLGPDGIVYPNWTRVGVDGGIPKVPVAATIEQFGGRANDEADDSAALAAACAQVGAGGGGAVQLGAGTYYLDQPVNIRHSGVVIRGAGRERTKIVFRYALPASGIRFYGLAEDRTVAPGDLIEVHALPKGLETVRIYAGDLQLHEWRRGLHSGNSFRVGVSLRNLFAKVPGDQAELRAVAEYNDGSPARTLAVPVRLDRELKRAAAPSPEAAILFAGNFHGPQIKLARDGARGALWLELESTEGLVPGDKLFVDGPATERWKTLTQNACRWGSYRSYAVRAVAVEGNRVRLEQPLRIEFPVIDGSYVRKMNPIEWCGVEDLEIEQTENLWINTVQFRYAWNCWTRGLKVRMTGRFPVDASVGKWCEVRDCIFDDAWFKGGGGTAYTGWQNSWDCLMDNVETFEYRHAPLVQWSASGNVVRNGVFHNSDAQWHAGWSNENLFENCVVVSRRGSGAYGYGMWASPPEDEAHGPNGPRNVVYNCDVLSERDGLWMGGMNENWLILYNRFVVEKGQGVFAKTASFDHIIRGNVFVIQDQRSSGVYLATPDCIGAELIDNTFHGAASIYAGSAKLAVDRGNRLLPADAPPPPPPPPP
ncbi:MAG: right-handed parallel beta-helix repeat-containing protein, partial [Lentisphaeria bacterium]|nr:right-handed parallel beta-helix repeat-containing protein [Lentisphaeria bacterium]